MILAFAFTGYLLPWDQTAYYATKVGLNIMRSVPLVERTRLAVARWLASAAAIARALANLNASASALRRCARPSCASLMTKTRSMLASKSWRSRPASALVRSA